MLDIMPSGVAPRYALEVGDEVALDRTTWIVRERRENKFIFVEKEGSRVPQEFTDTQLAAYVARGQFQHTPWRAREAACSGTVMAKAQFLASRTEAEHLDAKCREAYVLALDHFYRAGEIKITDEAISASEAMLRVKASEIYSNHGGKHGTFLDKFSSKTLRRWRKAYSIGGLTALYDNKRLRGNRDDGLEAEVSAFIQPIICGYMHPNAPSKAKIWEDVKAAILEENARRQERLEKVGAGERCDGPTKLLACPSRTTVMSRINDLDEFECLVRREGKDAARKKLGLVGSGLQVLFPLQRVELDEWRTDLMTLLGKSALLDYLSEEERTRLGLGGKPVRVLVTVAVDVATKCIVGMKISLEGSTESALQTVEMILEDKGKYADVVGAMSAWNQAGLPSRIVTDCAKYNTSERTKQAIAVMGSTLEYCPAGVPEMKGTIERLFGTMSVSLLHRLSGRTFGSVAAKGDKDPEKAAALTIKEFCDVLVRWVVDIYHRRPHKGLHGDTPQEAWDRLTAQYGVTAPDMGARVLAFGHETTRIYGRDGVTLMNIRYQSRDKAARLMRMIGKEVKIRWHHGDLGTIYIEIEGEWYEMKAVHAWAKGLTASAWELVVRELNARRRRNEEISAAVVADAIRYIDQVNSAAMQRENILVDAWSKERLNRLEDSLIHRFSMPDEDIEAKDEAVATTRFGRTLGRSSVVTPVAASRDDAAEEGHQEASASAEARYMPGDVPAAPDPDISETMFGETTPESFSALGSSNANPLRRRSRRSAAEKSGDVDGFTFEY